MHPVYRGVPRQFGGGLGSMFKSMMKTAIPMIKPQLQSAFKVLKNEGIKQGVGALQDLMDNKEVHKKVLKRRAQSLGKAILKRIKPTPVSKPSHSTPKPRAKRTRRLRHRGFVKRRNLRARPLDIFD